MTDINGDKIVSSVPFAFHNSKVVPLHGSCIHFANSKASESSVSRTPIITTDSVAKSKSLLFDSSIRTESSSNSRSSNINITDRELKTATLNSHSPSGEFVIIDEDVGSSNPYHERCIPSLPVLSALDKARETTILKLYVKLMFEDRARILDLIHREFGARVCSSVFLEILTAIIWAVQMAVSASLKSVVLEPDDLINNTMPCADCTIHTRAKALYPAFLTAHEMQIELDLVWAFFFQLPNTAEIQKTLGRLLKTLIPEQFLCDLLRFHWQLMLFLPSCCLLYTSQCKLVSSATYTYLPVQVTSTTKPAVYPSVQPIPAMKGKRHTTTTATYREQLWSSSNILCALSQTQWQQFIMGTPMKPSPQVSVPALIETLPNQTNCYKMRIPGEIFMPCI